MTRTELLLLQTGEECAEITQRISKSLRFGLLEVEPGQDKNNMVRLSDEVNDLLGMIEMLKNEGLIIVLQEKIWAKMDKVEKYLEYSRTCGRLTEN